MYLTQPKLSFRAPTYEDASLICKEVLDAFSKGEIGEIYLAYTHFKNTVSHEPVLMKLLPVEFDEAELQEADSNVLMNYEPNEEEALDLIIPHQPVLWRIGGSGGK